MFNLFNTRPYTFIVLDKQLIGKVSQSEYEAEGIIKFRDGIIVNNNAETFGSSASLHIKPSETFITALNGNLLGNGIRITNDVGVTEDYKIVGQSIGVDFDTGNVEFYKVALQKESIVKWDDSPSILN